MLMTQEKKLEHKRIIKLIKDMNVPKEYCGRQKSIKLSVHIKGESPFYIPDNFGIGGILVVGNTEGKKDEGDKEFVGALRSKSNRRKIKKLNDEYTDDFLKDAAYFRYKFKFIENDDKIKDIQAFVFCSLLDILEPRLVIVLGKLRDYIAGNEFAENARKIWPELKNVSDGDVLKKKGYNVVGLKKSNEVKKDRELMEIRHLLNELGHAIANVHDIFKFVEEEIDSDIKKEYFEDYAETCEQKLDSQYTLFDQWGKLRTKSYRLEKGENADGIIENAEIMCKLTFFLYKRKKVLSFSDIAFAMSCIKWIRANEIYCNDKNKFYDLLECALDKEKQKCCSDDRMKTYLREMPKREGGSRGFDNTLNAIYEFLVTVTTRKNSLCADFMEHSFFKGRKFSGLQNSSEWKDENGCWKKGTKFWLPKSELMKKKVDWRHINWHYFLEEN